MLELATPADREAVEQMAQQVHAMHAAWRPDIFEIPQELYSEERFLSAVRERKLYVAKLQGIAVGFVLVAIREYDRPGLVRRRVMVVEELVVHESCTGQGIGTQIMGDVHALAKAFRCTDLQLGVYPQNDSAVAFYQKCGFQIRSIDMQKKV